MRRGEVWWVNFDPSAGMEIRKQRPAVILTVNALNKARGTVVVVPLSTSAKPRPPIVVPLPSAGGNSVAVCDQLCAADKRRFGKQIGVLSANDLSTLTESVKIVLGLT
ncbi:type II toxin-antitoxin system PemK/MazF family toxin [Desulfovibrio sp. OttesenSCG-928-F20]|nr:type II toxin-antitoxin system PemK/MazF family toxin [Desulfovibrio sp. OttesenSCG-928-G15]MDL2290877.1 type II toxin-antitoxin system PemK/MazF family toxin [Desulfovibrio sp. OttesenSCG-928-F20]